MSSIESASFPPAETVNTIGSSYNVISEPSSSASIRNERTMWSSESPFFSTFKVEATGLFDDDLILSLSSPEISSNPKVSVSVRFSEIDIPDSSTKRIFSTVTSKSAVKSSTRLRVLTTT